MRARVRVSEYGERQMAVYTAKGAASEAQGEAAALQAGFGRWTLERQARALVLTELEAGEETEVPDELIRAAPPIVPAPPPAQEAEPVALTVLQRVSRRMPLSMADHDEVLTLTRGGLMHVTPELDRKDPCPYRLTDDGRRALREGR